MLKYIIQDPETAQFSRCALPYISLLPLAVISLVAASISLGESRPFKRWRPGWTKPFIEEESLKEDEPPREDSRKALLWTLSLTSLAVIALLIQVIKLSKFPDLQLHAIFLLASWALVALLLAIIRPANCPTSLLAYYFLVLVAELAAVDHGQYLPRLKDDLCYFGAAFSLVSICLLLGMPLRTASPLSGPISSVGSAPTNTKRTPEDKLRLWQFLTVTWISPLLRVGKKRQLQKEDIWELPFEFETSRITQAFRELHGTVFRRLLKANGIDCCILILTSFTQLFCGK